VLDDDLAGDDDGISASLFDTVSLVEVGTCDLAAVVSVVFVILLLPVNCNGDALLFVDSDGNGDMVGDGLGIGDGDGVIPVPRRCSMDACVRVTTGNTC